MRQVSALLSVLLFLTLLSACAPAPEAGGNQNETPAGEDHSAHEMANEGGSAADAPFDALFIDGMIEHHAGAITMAEEVLENSERPELLALAEAIIAAQTSEIEQMQSWRDEWFSGLAQTVGMDMDMGDMSLSSDETIPFDQRFIQAMISHHEGAIHMAEEALAKSEREEIRALAENVIATQSAEIEQMRGWLAEWFGVTE